MSRVGTKGLEGVGPGSDIPSNTIATLPCPKRHLVHLNSDLRASERLQTSDLNIEATKAATSR